HNAQIVVHADDNQIGTFDASAVTTIHASGFAGNDTIIVSPKINATVVLDGGAGNDHLVGGGGSNILLGGPGRDDLTGGDARDILIGGDGTDKLSGRKGDDILIGASTQYDSNPTALMQILTSWNGTNSYHDRVIALRAGNGAPKLDSTTLIDDAVVDRLFGD